jgi:FixJ family two-component response regulator
MSRDRVIVVDDDESMRRAIERIMTANGFVVLPFDSAEAAIRAGVAMEAACLILDICLPGISGFELYRRLAPAGEQLRTIFITAHNEPSAREEAAGLRASGFLPKPFSGRTLLDAVARATGRI